MKKLQLKKICSPIGDLIIGATNKGLCLLLFADTPSLDNIIQRTAKRLNCNIIEICNKIPESNSTESNSTESNSPTEIDYHYNYQLKIYNCCSQTKIFDSKTERHNCSSQTEINNCNSQTGINNCNSQTEISNCSSQEKILAETEQQLKEYFRGERTQFTIPLVFTGTHFQNQVWQTLLKIPYGETCSYKQEAIAVGNPKACRAVASANGANPICIIIPCHRVIASVKTPLSDCSKTTNISKPMTRQLGKDSQSKKNLGGYSAGLWRKEFLLTLEQTP